MKTEQLFIGLMSGSSCDGIDGVLIEIEIGDDPAWKILAHRHEPYSAELCRRLLAVADAAVADVCRLHRDLADHSVAVVRGLLAASGRKAADIAAIGSHGHTICHLSPPVEARVSTLQIGDASVIAQATAILTVSGFRGADVAVGGHGAPLVPQADAILFSKSRPEKGVVILNLGGIANVTVLDSRGTRAFDTGPACMLIDALAREWTDGEKSMDEDAAFSRDGCSLSDVLESWLEASFFALEPPKSAAREDFGAEFLARTHTSFPDASTKDLLRTAVELTAVSVRGAVPDASTTARELWLAGGGARHSLLRDRIAAAFGGAWTVVPIEERVPMAATQREAAAFAVLARETLAGRAGNCPAATGATRAVILGQVAFP